ncbi:hypothetical protein [Bacillus sp. FSL K6-3431]|uniref:hypothetical protein n=1 Tax=Bacillus sp. FSL K6-3431 TaxID=2921500 RepID=UPI0030F52A4E
MEWNDDYIEDIEKTKFLTKIGCLFWIIIGTLVILLITWNLYHTIYPIQLMVSHSPTNKNKIEIVRIEDFPDPTLRINYDNKQITKTTLADKISIEWKNDYEANVMLTKHEREPDIVKIEFK